ncbi:MAG: PEP/pyruvate-binding domain-containing protein, partial [Devosia sp.]
MPPGFATTADAYWAFVDANGLREQIAARLAAWEDGRATLAQTGEAIRGLFLAGNFPAELAQAIHASYAELARRSGREDVEVAVRSSATAEDLPDASFAGQQETFLNIRGGD